MIARRLQAIEKELPSGVKLVAVSKFHPAAEVLEAFAAGQRVFGENRPQELYAKAPVLPREIEWHFIGHLQTNKLKLVLPYAALVESIDSLHLLDAVQAWADAHGKEVRVLLEVHVGAEETKGGFAPEDVPALLSGHSAWPQVRFCGLMGMASHTGDETRIRADFARLKALFDQLRAEAAARGDSALLDDFRELSMGMSGDWRIAVEYGATIVRIGTAIFGPRA